MKTSVNNPSYANAYPYLAQGEVTGRVYLVTEFGTATILHTGDLSGLAKVKTNLNTRSEVAVEAFLSMCLGSISTKDVILVFEKELHRCHPGFSITLEA